VVLDDDPTGTQTVHGVDILADWSVAALSDALAGSPACFFILTNSRSLPEPEAVALNREIAANLLTAGRHTGRRFAVVSRSDSTLRGHFPAETDALLAGLSDEFDGTVLAPAFFEGGRITVDDMHMVAHSGRWVQAAETEFARDAAFGYRNSNLRLWVQEKTHGAVLAQALASLDLKTLRSAAGAGAVRAHLMGLRKGTIVIVNAANYRDMEVAVHGLLQAEAAGRRYLYRTAASFVRVRAGLSPRSLLAPGELKGDEHTGGLVVVGSYVQRSTEQLRAALALPDSTGIEFDVNQLRDPQARSAQIAAVAARAESAIRAGANSVIYTSRQLETSLGKAGELGAARIVSAALVEVVCRIRLRPGWFIAKGGITASDLAVQGLGVRRARVLGQAAPGIPVWRTGPESRHPGLTYIVFPGNVGTAETLRDLMATLARP
jgi:uncharacterized protein YgbK (DUF1537 family)